MRFIVIPLALTAVVGCVGCEIRATNPFDPETACEFQARTRFAVTIQSVQRLEEAAACEPIAADHSGFVVALTPNDVCDPSAAEVLLTTEASGTATFVDVPSGTYTLSFRREGFELPRDEIVFVGVGTAEIDGSVFCGINRNAPPLPSVQGLPPLVNGDNIAPGESAPPTLVLLEPVPGLLYEVTEIPEVGAPSPTRPLDTATPNALELVVANNAEPARRTWRVVVSAEDALGNRSELPIVIVKDELAPLEVSNVQAISLSDRVFLSWDAPLAVNEGDDAATSFLVSYGLVPRVAPSTDAECPEAGRPFDEVFDDASFLLEGESPLGTSSTTLTLSGALPGTDLFLYVAAVDAVGNVGCYSVATLARPDDVTFAPDTAEPVAAFAEATGARAFAQIDDVTALARGSGGLTLIDRAGVAHVIAGTGNIADVAADGTRFLAVGAAGLVTVDIDADGAPVGDGSVTGIGALTAVAVRHGRLLLGTNGGVRIADIDNVAGAGPVNAVGHPGEPVTAIENAGDFIVLVRGGPPSGTPGRVQLVNPDLTTIVADVALSSLPFDLVVHGGRVILASPSGLQVLDALTLAGPDAAPLPGGGNPVALLAFDDVVLAAVNASPQTGADSVTALSLAADGSATIAGKARMAADEDIIALVPQSAGVCAFADTSADGVRRCFSSTALPTADRDVRMASPATFVRMDGSLAYLVAGADVAVHTLDGAFVATGNTGGATIAGVVALPGLGAFVVDNDARAFVVSPAGVVREVADADTVLRAAAPAVTGDVDAQVGVLGDDVVVSLTELGADGPASAALVRLRISEESSGELSAARVGALALPDAESFANLVVHRQRVYLPSRPFGLLVVDIADAASPALLSAESALPEADASNGAFDVTFVTVDGVEHVLAPAEREGVPRVFLMDGGPPVEVQTGGLPTLGSASRLGDLVVFGASEGGAFAVKLVDTGAAFQLGPVLQVPSVSGLREPVVTARGFAAALGEEARWIRLR